MKSDDSYVLVTDSAADFLPQQAEQLGLVIIPLNVYMKDNPSQPCLLQGEDFYGALRSGRTACVSAANLSAFRSVFGEILQQGKDIVYLAVSSALSCMYATAQIAASELLPKYPERKITVLDTRCTGMGEGLLVYGAVTEKEKGVSADGIAAYVTENRLRIRHRFAAGERFARQHDGKLSALSAGMLSRVRLYAMQELDAAGKLTDTLKLRSRKRAVRSIGKQYAAECTDKTATVCIAHADALADAEMLKAVLLREYGARHVVIGNLGPVTGVRTGQGTVALFYSGTPRE